MNNRMKPLFLTIASCLDYGLASPDRMPRMPPGDEAEHGAEDDGTTGAEPETEEGGAESTETVTLRGTVTVLDWREDENGAAEELEPDQYAYGPIWVDTFVQDPLTGDPVYGPQTAILIPTLGANAWELDLTELDGATIYVQAMLDEDRDNLIEVAAWSALWHERLRVIAPGVYDADLDLVEQVDLFINVPKYENSGAGGGFTPPPPVIELSGGATIADDAGERCIAPVFSSNWFGPYYSGAFYATAEPAWNIFLPGEQGDMQLGAVCDANVNMIFDPADAWGTWVEEGSARSPLAIGTVDIPGLQLEIPYTGAFTTAEPIVTVSGTLAGISGDGVVYVAGLRGEAPIADAFEVSALAREHGWGVFRESGAWSIPVPAWKEMSVWTWVDADADGWINGAGEPGVLLGNCYTDVSCAL